MGAHLVRVMCRTGGCGRLPAAVGEAARVLRPGGRLVYLGLHPAYVGAVPQQDPQQTCWGRRRFGGLHEGGDHALRDDGPSQQLGTKRLASQRWSARLGRHASAARFHAQRRQAPRRIGAHKYVEYLTYLHS